LTPETTHLISEERLKRMKKNAVLVNVARGPIVDERALAEALEKKNIWAAGLDVYEREPEIEERLLALENVVLLPHIGSATFETRIRMAVMAAENLLQGLSGNPPPNLV
jgi:glyoxylate reductase